MRTRGTSTARVSGIRTNCRIERDSKPLAATPPNCSSGGRLNWERFALWIFVAFSFAALAFAMYFMWAKCAGSPGF